jgi:DNA-binding response OmpR family regulator
LSNYSGKKRILIVDDEHDNSSIFKIGLEDAGFEVNAYSDPELALSAFKPDFYDLLILDIRMPKMDGYELYDKIRKKDNKVRSAFLPHLKNIKKNTGQAFRHLILLIVFL